MPNPPLSGTGRLACFACLLVLLATTAHCRFTTPPAPTAIAQAPTPTPPAPPVISLSLTPTTHPSPTKETPPATATATATPLPSATASPTTIPSPTTPPASPTTPATPTPLHYCAHPPDDYTLVNIGDHTLNVRTLAMLETAQQIYGGPGDLLRIVQGSFSDNVAASFGTHAGGGAVDISIRDSRDVSVVLWEEAEAMVMALRYAGFAAWYRQIGDLGQGSGAHIHAIAIGDRDLSPAAQEQVSGDGGYFNGMDGLIPPWGPNPDRQGGPIICPWMLEPDAGQSGDP